MAANQSVLVPMTLNDLERQGTKFFGRSLLITLVQLDQEWPKLAG